jgi:hypothetical protein
MTIQSINLAMLLSLQFFVETQREYFSKTGDRSFHGYMDFLTNKMLVMDGKEDDMRNNTELKLKVKEYINKNVKIT